MVFDQKMEKNNHWKTGPNHWNFGVNHWNSLSFKNRLKIHRTSLWKWFWELFGFLASWFFGFPGLLPENLLGFLASWLFGLGTLGGCLRTFGGCTAGSSTSCLAAFGSSLGEGLWMGGRQRLRRLLILLLLLVVVQLLVLVVRQRSASMPSWRQCAWTKTKLLHDRGEVSGEALREDLENTLSQNSYTRRARGLLKVV